MMPSLAEKHTFRQQVNQQIRNKVMAVKKAKVAPKKVVKKIVAKKKPAVVAKKKVVAAKKK